jgi:hypothetical protein
MNILRELLRLKKESRTQYCRYLDQNGAGSSDTKIARWTTLDSGIANGVYFTFSDTAGGGSRWTFHRACNVTISQSVQMASNNIVGLVLNPESVEDPVTTSITNSQWDALRLVASAIESNTQTENMSWTGRVKAGDQIVTLIDGGTITGTRWSINVFAWS